MEQVTVFVNVSVCGAVFSVEEDVTELDLQVRQNMEQISVFVNVSVYVFVSVYTSNDFAVPSSVWRKISQSWTDKSDRTWNLSLIHI